VYVELPLRQIFDRLLVVANLELQFLHLLLDIKKLLLVLLLLGHALDPIFSDV